MPNGLEVALITYVIGFFVMFIMAGFLSSNINRLSNDDGPTIDWYLSILLYRSLLWPFVILYALIVVIKILVSAMFSSE